MSSKERHSEDYFNKARDFWWNRDFLELMARRWNVQGISSVLDIGCGIGHWGRILADILPQSCKIVGLDREPDWVTKAGETAAAIGADQKFEYCVGLADELPFRDASFDMVTCQTLLIHVPSPKKVLSEAMRVLRPGGLFVAAEPNNRIQPLIQHSANRNIEHAVQMTRFECTIEQGKINLGEGDDSYGDLLPGDVAEAGFLDIQVYQSDKVVPLIPPYETEQEKAYIEGMKELSTKHGWYLPKEAARKRFLAGRGLEQDFEILWQAAVLDSQERMKAIDTNTYHSGHGNIFYLVSGRRPTE